MCPATEELHEPLRLVYLFMARRLGRLPFSPFPNRCKRLSVWLRSCAANPFGLFRAAAHLATADSGQKCVCHPVMRRFCVLAPPLSFSVWLCFPFCTSITDAALPASIGEGAKLGENECGKQQCVFLG